MPTTYLKGGELIVPRKRYIEHESAIALFLAACDRKKRKRAETFGHGWLMHMACRNCGESHCNLMAVRVACSHPKAVDTTPHTI